MTTTRSFPPRRVVAAAMTVVVTAVAALGLYDADSQASAQTAGSPANITGAWGFRFQATVGAAVERNIGTMTFAADGSCLIQMRSNFGGVAHDHRTPTCTWTPVSEGNGLDGRITATGIAEPGPTVISYVLTDGSRRLLLLLDGTAPGVSGEGEAFRAEPETE